MVKIDLIMEIGTKLKKVEELCKKIMEFIEES